MAVVKFLAFFRSAKAVGSRAGAKYETCSQSLASDIFAVGANPKVTYQFPANLAEQRPPARGLKFRPRSTGGRFFEVGILAWN